MVRWLQPFLVACLVQGTLALAQVAMPKADNLALHEVDGRTALHSNLATAVVGSLGEVVRTLRQDPEVITAVVNDVVYGSLMVVTVNPEMFAKDIEVPSAAQLAVKRAVEALELSSREVRVSLAWLADFPHATRVDFQVAFDSLRHRQAFTLSVVTDGGRNLTDRICAGVPRRFKGGCAQPAASLLQLKDDDVALSLVGSGSDEEAGVVLPANRTCYGHVTVKPQGPPEDFLELPEWQEAVAMTIATTARVSRVQVGTMMSALLDAVRVDFWLSQGKAAACSEVAIRRVMTTSLSHATYWQTQRWRFARKGGNEVSVYGRIMFEVPDRTLFATNRSVVEAVQRAVAQVAAGPAPKARLLVTSTNVSLTADGNLSETLRLGFGVGFDNPRDRQVFSEDLARDRGKSLADTINKEVQACHGRCRLPRPGQEEAAQLDERYGSILWYDGRSPQLASDPLVQDAVALAISHIASVPQRQVGILLTAEYTVVLRAEFWVVLSNATVREAAIQRVDSAGSSKFFRCTLAHLDRLQEHRPAGVAVVSIVLRVPDVRHFANSSAVREAVVGAMLQVAVVPIRQAWNLAIQPDLWEESLQLVRVDFRVPFQTRELSENFTRALAGDGVEKFVRSLNELVPKPFKGKCQLPVPDEPKASNSALLPQRHYGTMLLRLFNPASFFWPATEALAMTIAEVALVPRRQVAISIFMTSSVVLSIDFWVVSSNATLRQVAIERVNRDWTEERLKLVWQRVGMHKLYPLFMVGGGTLLNGPGRFSCDGPGV